MAVWGWLINLVKGAVKGLAKGVTSKGGVSSAKGSVKGIAKSAIGGAMGGGGKQPAPATADSGIETAMAQTDANKSRGLSGTIPKVPSREAGTDPSVGQVALEIGKGYVQNQLTQATGNIGQKLQTGGKVVSSLGAKKTGTKMKNIGGFLSNRSANQRDYEEDDEDQKYNFIGGSQR